MSYPKFYLIIVVSFLLTSCGTFRINRTKEFTAIREQKEQLNNNYSAASEINKKNDYRRNVLGLFNIWEECNYFNLQFENNDSVSISYWAYNDTVSTLKKKSFKGVWKEKYFEIYFSRKALVIPVIYTSVNIDRIRIGRDKNGDLVVMHFQDNSGNILLLGGGYANEQPYIFKKAVDVADMLPYQENGKWGFRDLQENIKITAQYDYVYPYKHGAAIVKLNGKYGLIDKENNLLASIIYDKIEYLNNRYGMIPKYNIKLNGKYGMLDSLGVTKIPIIYDSLENRWNEKFLIIKDGKYGYASSTSGVIIPAVYDQAFWFNYGFAQSLLGTNPNIAQVKRNGLVCFVDDQGYEYDAKLRKGMFKTMHYLIDESSKRKIVQD